MEMNNNEDSLTRKDVIKMAGLVFGSDTEAEKWLSSESFILSGNRPIDMLDTENGIRAVAQLLYTIEDIFNGIKEKLNE